ncbi:hypothetical protein BGW36DRAFT_360338 [Talaromyces proteolyticus]|uniref:Uncharacterized protein n=1 Tax=Talaromyces proteolyticus TaxID=1131652 RepID=A0AAD4KPX1_9EURO|nr:uncharacterized protein BGW36DRAFT_360338 [Talaromyces proteolyticus]KAH8696511.1 hypothetical protein BGW36DRAFT_360338 [Talaromyces proteolyticus]
MDETGVPLSVLDSLKVLVSKHDLRDHRGAAVKRTLVTGVECISVNGRFLSPLIWPAATHRGANAIERARHAAFTRRNIRSGWAKTGLVPFDPNQAIRGIQKSRPDIRMGTEIAVTQGSPVSEGDTLITAPVTDDGFIVLRNQVEADARSLDRVFQNQLEKLNQAAKRAIAEQALLLDEDRLLFEQNTKKMTTQSTRSRIVGHAKAMNYETFSKHNETGTPRRFRRLVPIVARSDPSP